MNRSTSPSLKAAKAMLSSSATRLVTLSAGACARAGPAQATATQERAAVSPQPRVIDTG